MAVQSEALARVLLIDDSLPDIILTEETLEQDRIKLEFVALRDGFDALNYLRRDDGFSDAARPDLVLLDLNMPDIDGKELLAEMKTDARLNDIPVVVLSGSDASSDIEETKALGAIDYIQKPLSYEKLLSIVQYTDHLGFEEVNDHKYLFRIGG